MSSDGRLQNYKGKVHYVTIPEEDWHDLTRTKCRSFSKKYGVSGQHHVWPQVRSGNTTNRTFPIIHLVPHLLSLEELTGDYETLKRIVFERELNGDAVRKRRDFLHWKAQGKEVESAADDELDEEEEGEEDELSQIPAATPTTVVSNALTRVNAARTTPCFGLHLLVTIQNEDRHAQHAHDGCGAALRAGFARLPMAVLNTLISDLWSVRQEWKQRVLAPCAAALAAERARTETEEINALLFHICLWQRRYPLHLLLSVLNFHEHHRSAFRPASPRDPPEPQQVEALLEEGTRACYPDFTDVPGLIRADVLMTYPQMPLEEQVMLMRSVAAACRRRSASNSKGSETSAKAAQQEEDEADTAAALTRHSRTAPDPRRLLAAFVAPTTTVPRRFCAGLSTAGYREMREAFERHKRDGVRRLAAQDYDCAPPDTPQKS